MSPVDERCNLLKFSGSTNVRPSGFGVSDEHDKYFVGFVRNGIDPQLTMRDVTVRSHLDLVESKQLQQTPANLEPQRNCLDCHVEKLVDTGDAHAEMIFARCHRERIVLFASNGRRNNLFMRRSLRHTNAGLGASSSCTCQGDQRKPSMLLGRRV